MNEIYLIRRYGERAKTYTVEAEALVVSRTPKLRSTGRRIPGLGPIVEADGVLTTHLRIGGALRDDATKDARGRKTSLGAFDVAKGDVRSAVRILDPVDARVVADADREIEALVERIRALRDARAEALDSAWRRATGASVLDLEDRIE